MQMPDTSKPNVLTKDATPTHLPTGPRAQSFALASPPRPRIFDDLPEHEFEPELDFDPLDPDTRCMATVKTADHDEHGYEHLTQCGFTRRDHNLPSPKIERPPGYISPFASGE